MTTATSTRVLPAAAGPRRSASLGLVPQRRSTAAKAPFVVAVVGLLVAGLLGLLLLNTVVAQNAFRLHDLQQQGRVLGDREQALAKQVQALQAPGAISDRALALGMVPGGVPVFLRLPDGAVLGAVTGPGSASPPARPAGPIKPAPKPVVGPTRATTPAHPPGLRPLSGPAPATGPPVPAAATTAAAKPPSRTAPVRNTGRPTRRSPAPPVSGATR